MRAFNHAKKALLAQTRYIGNCVCGRNEALLPGGRFWGNFVLDQLPQLGDSWNFKVYSAIFEEESGKDIKVGHAWRGDVRAPHYPDGTCLPTMFDLDNQNADDHRVLVSGSLQLCRDHCSIKPEHLPRMCIQDVISMEEDGLSFFLRVFFYILTHNACAILGGGITIRGFLRRLLLFVVESGAQMLLVLKKVPLRHSSHPHEWLHGSLKWVQDSHALCCTKINEFFAKLETLGMGPQLEHLMKD